MSSQGEEEEEEEDSGSDMMSSPPPPPAGFSDQNKEWLKPAVGKKTKKKTKKKEEDVQPQRNDLLDGSDGESGHELGEANIYHDFVPL